MSYSIFPLGDSTLTVDFGNIISEEINRKVLLLASAITEARLPAIKDIVPAYSSLAVHYDVVELLKLHKGRSAFQVMSEQMEAFISYPIEAHSVKGRKLDIPVCYSPRYGLDLAEVSEFAKLAVDEVVRLHTGRQYSVYMLGFLPGFAYMARVDERIAIPRKPEPRAKIEAGFVGIAGEQTGIYPLASPGGWQIVGKTPLKLFDKDKEDPVFFKAGDQVHFYSITEDEFDNY